MSVIMRSAGSGGTIQAFCAMYSLRMSFWIVPRSFSGATPWLSPAAM